MKIFNVRLGFATNSSSTHSIILCEKIQLDKNVESYFGWEDFVAASSIAKANYLAAILFQNITTISEDMAIAVVKDWCKINTSLEYLPSVDHQSVFSLPQDYEMKGVSKEFFSDFSAYLMQDKIAIIGGNDNDNIVHPLISEGKVINIPLELDSRYNIICRKDKNYWSIFNKDTGLKIRFSFNDLDLVPTRSHAPELVDLKITDLCSRLPKPIQETEYNGNLKYKDNFPVYKMDKNNVVMGLGGGGECKYCYQGSSPNGLHGNTKYIKSVLRLLAEQKVFEVAFSGGEPTQHPDFVAIIDTAYLCGIVPNFTTKSLLWIKQPWAKSVLSKCGGVAYSVTTAKQVLKYKEAMDAIGYPDYNKKLMVHCVLGTVTKTEFRKILEAVASNNMGITLLGYKTTGRGCEFKPIAHNWWLEIVDEVADFDYGLRLGIDTVIAQEYEQELIISNISEVLYSKSEGKFSCYIDGVTEEIAPSSFADKTEFKKLHACSSTWLNDYHKF